MMALCYLYRNAEGQAHLEYLFLLTLYKTFSKLHRKQRDF